MILRSFATAFVGVTMLSTFSTATLSEAAARDQIRIVGSSTVFPFSTTVAENFGKTGSFKTPVVEATGSGGGLKLFCSGVGVSYPDIANSSRPIKKSEFDMCGKNGVDQITEVRIGFDGIVVANTRNAPLMSVNLDSLFLALAKDLPDENGKWVPNHFKNWSDIDPALPATAIEVLGPPPTSGTRDAFVELVMEPGCLKLPACVELKKTDPDAFKARFASLREDGRYVEAGENDNLIVQKLGTNPTALGIFGFSFLDQNNDKIQAAHIGGVEPTFESISDGDYPVSRSLYFYVKNAHAGVIPGLGEFVTAFTSESAWGPDGYLADKGLIPLPDDERAAEAREAQALTPMASPANGH